MSEAIPSPFAVSVRGPLVVIETEDGPTHSLALAQTFDLLAALAVATAQVLVASPDSALSGRMVEQVVALAVLARVVS